MQSLNQKLWVHEDGADGVCCWNACLTLQPALHAPHTTKPADAQEFPTDSGDCPASKTGERLDAAK